MMAPSTQFQKLRKYSVLLKSIWPTSLKTMPTKNEKSTPSDNPKSIALTLPDKLSVACSPIAAEWAMRNGICMLIVMKYIAMGERRAMEGDKTLTKKTEWGPGSHRTRIMPEVIERERETVEAAPSSLDLFDHDGVGQEHSVFKAQSNADRRPRAHKVGS
mmetsp:Transcript_31030/g.73196  ORF Transcript_31030/g.73196 Transcript_31030/m.73196 type:complete len:160 (-) Transcript_31030:179-658(-)